MKKIAFIVLILMMQLSATQSQETDEKFDPRISELVSQNVLQLANDVGREVINQKGSDAQSIVFSPLSIFAVLSTLLLGSNGNTYEELMRLLRYSNDRYLAENPWKAHEEFGLLLDDIDRDLPNPRHRRPMFWEALNGASRRPHSRQNRTDDGQKIYVANGLFVQSGFSIRLDYKDVIETVYRSTLHTLDFIRNGQHAMEFLNTWVNTKTRGKIPKLLDGPLPPETKFVIASALYFKAQWESTFIEELTRTASFYPDGANGRSINVEMMPLALKTAHHDSAENDCQIIALPYKGHVSTMFIILPNNSSRQKLQQFQANLTSQKINEMIEKMQLKTTVLSIPKMHLISTIHLKETLQTIGLSSLFRQDQADLSLISSGAEFLPNFITQSLNILKPIVSNTNTEDERFIFTRFNAENGTESRRYRSRRSAVTYKASSEFRQSKEPLRLKDLVIGKRITKSYPHKKVISRGRRHVSIANLPDPTVGLRRLDALRHWSRNNNLPNPGIFADDVIHKIDLTINERGTEGGAVTYTTAVRSAEVIFRADTPFMFLIRHDDTKLPLFYGTVFEPTN